MQRDAPDAHRGSSFARFEARFQVIWVIGGFLPVIVAIPARLGFLVVAGVAGFGLFTYLAGLHAAQAATPGRQPVDAGGSVGSESDGSGSSMRASQSPGASTSAGVGSSRSDRHSRSSASQPCALDDPVDEPGAPVVGGLRELEAEQPLDEPVRRVGRRPGAAAAPR